MLKNTLAIAAAVATLSLTACANMQVRQPDLDAWVGAPVEALDTHSLFVTMPVSRSMSSDGIEVRNYVNSKEVASCFTSTSGKHSGSYQKSSAFTTCSNSKLVCNNIFYIKDGKVLEYAPTGNCFTNDSVKPQGRYMRLKGM